MSYLQKNGDVEDASRPTLLASTRMPAHGRYVPEVREWMVADAVQYEPVSLQIWEMQGEFAKMQRSSALNQSKSFLIS